MLERWLQQKQTRLQKLSKILSELPIPDSSKVWKSQHPVARFLWRMHAALLQEGIKVSPRTCGRIMAKHHALYGWDKPKGPAKPKSLFEKG